MKIQIESQEISIELRAVARFFAGLDNEQQAEFFNQVGEYAKDKGFDFGFQVAEISLSKNLTDSGRSILNMFIGQTKYEQDTKDLAFVSEIMDHLEEGKMDYVQQMLGDWKHELEQNTKGF